MNIMYNFSKLFIIYAVRVSTHWSRVVVKQLLEDLMSKNGFYHERPTDSDIAVAEHMVPIVGAMSINWRGPGRSEDYER
jgi:hypothetical protein